MGCDDFVSLYACGPSFFWLALKYTYQAASRPLCREKQTTLYLPRPWGCRAQGKTLFT